MTIKNDLTWTFEIRGRLIGHKCSKRAAFEKSFIAFKRTVRLLANVANVPTELDPKGEYHVQTSIRFRKKAHTDPENLRKSIIDALWAKDRRVLSGSYSATENTGEELAFVYVTRIK